MEQTMAKEERIVLRCDPEFLKRCDRIADEFYGGVRSVLVRRAITEVIERKEQELAGRQSGTESERAA